MRTVLITGANRGLGLKIATKLYKEGWDLFVTGRNLESLTEAYQHMQNSIRGKFAFDLSQFDNFASINKIFDQVPPLNAIIHCASPYMMKPFLETPIEELKEYTTCMLNEQVFFQKSITNLKANMNDTTFIVTGAVIGLPDTFAFGEMGLLKAHQRQLAAICDYELTSQAPRVHMKHLDLGTFRDEVEDSYKEISTDHVVDTINFILENPDSCPHVVHLVAPENEEMFNIRNTVISRKPALTFF